MGMVDGNTPVSDNYWETVKRGGDIAIERWINQQIRGRSCTVILVGSKTAGRKWITYEIKKSWNNAREEGTVTFSARSRIDHGQFDHDHRNRAPKGD